MKTFSHLLQYLVEFSLEWEISDKSCIEHHNTYFTFSNFFSENHAVYETMWKNMVQLDRPQMII
jgi:hypothetical protein